MDRHRTTWWVLSAAVIALTATLSAGTLLTWMVQQRGQHRSYYPAAQVRTVQLNVGAATVHVSPVTGAQATVTQDLRWLISKPLVNERFDQGTDTLYVDASCDGTMFLDTNSCTVDLTVAVPATTAINFESGSGTLGVSDMAGPVDAQAGSGDIALDRVSGPVNARVESGQISGTELRTDQVTAKAAAGEIDLVFALPPVSVTADVTSGQASVAVPRGTQYHVNASALSGDTSVAPGLDSSGATRTIAVSVASGEAEVNYR